MNKNSKSDFAVWFEGLVKSVVSRPRVLLAVIFALFTSLILVIGYYDFRQKDLEIVTTSDVCFSDGDLLQAIASGRDSGDREALRAITETIKQKPDYDKDQNCLYGMLHYYLVIADITNVRSTYNQYSAIYAAERDMFSNSKLATLYKEDLLKRVNNLEESNRKAIENAKRKGQYVPE